MELINERWAEIKGWEGKYYISDHGRFKSVGGKYKVSMPDGYITTGSLDSTGYMGVTMRRPPKECYQTRIHVLVANHFCDKPEGSTCVNHLDGNKLNNHYTNLEHTTLGDNVRHAAKMGLMRRGETHKNSKLTSINVIEMRRLRKTGLTQQVIGDMFGVSRAQARDVISGLNWGWLKEGL